MKKEHIIAFGGTWHHFFINPSLGLCVSKKTDMRFVFSECILKDAFDDFYVTATEKNLHVVCQDLSGAIIYFTYDGETWKHRRLLESRDKTPAFKNLTLTLIGDFVNLFYVIHSKENTILVHQLLGEQTSQPKVVDYITGTCFCVCGHQTSDLTVLYRNGDNVCGTKKFRWSRKDFDGFQPLNCGCELDRAVVIADQDDNLQIAAYATFDKFENILFLTKSADTDECTISAVHLVSGESDGLALVSRGEGLSISWCENGLVMTTSIDENGKWSTPKKYIRGKTQENVLYRIQSETDSFSTYGYRQDGKIMLYITRDILEHPPVQKPQKRIVPQGQNPLKQQSYSSEYVKRSVYSADMAAVRKLLASQNDIIVEMLKKITALERTALGKNEIAEDENQIDRLAAANVKQEETSKN